MLSLTTGISHSNVSLIGYVAGDNPALQNMGPCQIGLVTRFIRDFGCPIGEPPHTAER